MSTLTSEVARPLSAPAVPASPLISASNEKLTISSKVKELAVYIAAAIRRRDASVSASAKPPGLVSAASIVLAAQLEGVPLKSLSSICGATGLLESDLQAYYKQLVVNVTGLLPPNYIPASKLRLYRKMSVDAGGLPSPSSTSLTPSINAMGTASPSLAAFSLGGAGASLPDMCAVKAESIVSSPSPTLTTTIVPAPNSPNSPVTIPLSMSRRASCTSVPSSPSLAARRGSICMDSSIAALFAENNISNGISLTNPIMGAPNSVSPKMQAEMVPRRASITSPTMAAAAKFAMQQVAQLNPQLTPKSSARAAAAVMASLANMDASDLMMSRKQFIEEARSPPTTTLPMPVAPAPTPRTPSLLGRRNSSCIAPDDSIRMQDQSVPKRSRMGIQDILCEGSSGTLSPMSLSSMKSLQLSSPQVHNPAVSMPSPDSDSNLDSEEEEDTDAPSSPMSSPADQTQH